MGTTYYEPDTICKIKTDAKIIIESHTAKNHLNETDGFRRSFIKRMFTNYIFRRQINIIEKCCDLLVVLTDGDRRNWKIEDNRIAVLPNPVTARSERTTNCIAHRVICAGRLREVKGFDMMIDVWSKVHTAHRDWQLYIFGEGEEEESLKSQISRYGLESSIHIMPFTKDIYAEYLRSSIFVLSSRYEGFPLVLIEAMECGVPCVSFDCQYGPSGIIKDREDGLIVENGNTSALADAICWMIEHEEERKEMGRKAKENVKRFSPDAIMAQWDKLFHELVDE